MRPSLWTSAAEVVALGLAACSTSVPAEDGGPLDATVKDSPSAEAAADVAADGGADTGPNGCPVTTCYGMVVIPPGGSVPYGDTCGTLCTCDCSGLCLGKCSWSPNCYCLDAGGQ